MNDEWTNVDAVSLRTASVRSWCGSVLIDTVYRFTAPICSTWQLHKNTGLIRENRLNDRV